MPPQYWRIISWAIHILFYGFLYGHWCWKRGHSFANLLGSFWALKLFLIMVILFVPLTLIMYLIYAIIAHLLAFLHPHTGVITALPKAFTLVVETAIIRADLGFFGSHVVFCLHVASFVAFLRSVSPGRVDHCGIMLILATVFMTHACGLLSSLPWSSIIFGLTSLGALYCLDKPNDFDGTASQGCALYIADVRCAWRYVRNFTMRVLRPGSIEEASGGSAV